jgi:hypothetical protein
MEGESYCIRMWFGLTSLCDLRRGGGERTEFVTSRSLSQYLMTRLEGGAVFELRRSKMGARPNRP